MKTDWKVKADWQLNQYIWISVKKNKYKSGLYTTLHVHSFIYLSEGCAKSMSILTRVGFNQFTNQSSINKLINSLINKCINKSVSKSIYIYNFMIKHFKSWICLIILILDIFPIIKYFFLWSSYFSRIKFFSMIKLFFYDYFLW